MPASPNNVAGLRQRNTTAAGTVYNRLSTKDCERTIPTFFETAFVPLRGIFKMFTKPPKSEYNLPGLDKRLSSITLLSKKGEASKVKLGKPGHIQPDPDPGNLIIGLPSRRRHGRYRLTIISLKSFNNDGHLIGALRRAYNRSWWGIVYLSTVSEIRIARISIVGYEVFVIAFDDMPPNDRTDYEYLPRPPKKQPPIDPSYLAHVFNYPNYNSLISTCWMIDQLPKLQSRYNYHIYRNPTEAWGVVIIERLDKRKVSLVILFSFFINLLLFYSLMPLCKVHLAWMFVLPHNVYIIALTLYHGFMATERFMGTERFMTSESLPSSDSTNEWIDACLRVIVPRVRWLYSSWRSFLTYILPCFGHEYLYPPSATDPHSNNELLGSPVQERTGVTNVGARTKLLPIHASPSLRPPYGPQNPLGSAASHDHDGGGRRDHDPDPDPNGISDPEAANLYLHLIISQGISGKQQIPINVTQLQNDFQLSHELNRAYRKHRGHWKALFSVRKLRPTKYILLNHAKHVRPDYSAANLASTMPDLVNGLNEYVFSYRPPNVVPRLPLLHEEQLTCLYFNPDSYVKDGVYDQQCFERAPKRKVELDYTGEGYPEGYGFEFVESFDIKFVLTCELLLVAVAFIFAFVYFGVAHDPQKASTAAQIAGLVFLIGQFMYGIIFALSERFEAWRFF